MVGIFTYFVARIAADNIKGGLFTGYWLLSHHLASHRTIDQQYDDYDEDDDDDDDDDDFWPAI